MKELQSFKTSGTT